VGTTRRESRERITAELMAAARRQLAAVGAAGLSLREVAREIGMVSSAVYRYVESRDDLLTRLIVEAYDSLGAVAEAARDRAGDAGDADRWLAVARAIRAWALAHPQEHLLLYGSPVPGYAAPPDTVVPGTRVTLALVSIVRDAHRGGRLVAPSTSSRPIDEALADDLVGLAGLTELPVGPETMVALLAAWTQLFGLVSFELTNQTRGMVEHHAELFDATARLGAERIGLR
jgi:AcrR family transcriptional regulator